MHGLALANADNDADGNADNNADGRADANVNGQSGRQCKWSERMDHAGRPLQHPGRSGLVLNQGISERQKDPYGYRNKAVSDDSLGDG